MFVLISRKKNACIRRKHLPYDVNEINQHFISVYPVTQNPGINNLYVVVIIVMVKFGFTFVEEIFAFSVTITTQLYKLYGCYNN